jgi:hypothetical protein
MVEPLLYAIRLMKFRNVRSEQTVLFLLKNVAGKKIDFGTWASIWQYSFTQSQTIGGFTYGFNPQQDWNEIAVVLLKIYKDLCNEAGCVDIQDETIQQRVREILRNLRELQTPYTYESIKFPNVEISLFGLEGAKRWNLR